MWQALERALMVIMEGLDRKREEYEKASRASRAELRQEGHVQS